MHRVDLAEAALLLKAAGVSEIRDFRWFDAPLEASLAPLALKTHAPIFTGESYNPTKSYDPIKERA